MVDGKTSGKGNLSMRRPLNSIILAIALLVLTAIPQSAQSTTIDTQTFSGANCGNSCFGATYQLVVTDAGDADPATFSATLTVAIGTYTGSMTEIGAVDIKVGNVVAPVTLVAAPGPEADWNTFFSGTPSGQAAGNCQNGNGGFLCSFDVGDNTNAPTTNNTTYTWTWNFNLDSNGYSFGHLGVNYTVVDDRCEQNDKGTKVLVNDCLQDGENISIGQAGGDTPGGGTPGGGTPSVPEPASALLAGSGLIALRVLTKKFRKN